MTIPQIFSKNGLSPVLAICNGQDYVMLRSVLAVPIDNKVFFDHMLNVKIQSILYIRTV